MLNRVTVFSRSSCLKSLPKTSGQKLFQASRRTFATDKAYSLNKPVADFPVEDFDKYKLQGAPEQNKAFAYFVVGATGMGFATAAKQGVVSALGSLSASSDVLALANVEVDLSTIPEGTTTTVKWRGKPLFVRHRTQEEIEAARASSPDTLPDPQTDESRVRRPEWLVVLGICTHLGCVPLGYSGDYNGWFCPCHGSHYDTSGRIRKGPAPANLEVPPYTFMTDDKLVVGVEG